MLLLRLTARSDLYTKGGCHFGEARVGKGGFRLDIQRFPLQSKFASRKDALVVIKETKQLR